MQQQLWRPDTCGCAVIESFDPDAAPDTPTLYTYEHKCEAHAHLNDAEAFAAVFDENDRKNFAWNLAVRRLDLTHADVEWAFDDARRVELLIAPKTKSLERQVADLRTIVAALASHQPFDPALFDLIPTITQQQKDDLAAELAGKATVR